MKYVKPFLVLMTVLSWFSLAFVGKKSIKRFLPTSLFMAIIVTVVQCIAKKEKMVVVVRKKTTLRFGIISFYLGCILCRFFMDYEICLWQF